MKINEVNRIIVSRTDSIGDVMLTLPFCAWLKERFPQATLVYLARGYTIPVVACFKPVDEILDWDLIVNLPIAEKIGLIKADCIVHLFPNKDIAALSKKAKIPFRIGTSHRIFHFLTCNYKVNFSRKNSSLHEAQLNFELARPFGLKSIPSFESTIAIGIHFSLPIKPTPTSVKNIDLSKAIVLHPKSQGSAIEWPIEKYKALSEQLIQSGKTVLITGTEKEGEMIRKQFSFSQHLIDLTGQLTLSELIALLAKVKVVVACSTGPIHIAAVVGTPTIALFSSRKPIHPGRWRPLGEKSKVLVFDENCQNCKKGKQCRCLEEISVELLIKQIDAL